MYLVLLCHGDILINLLGHGDILVVNVALLPDAELLARIVGILPVLCSMKASPTSGLMGRGLGPGDIRRRGNYRTDQAAQVSEHYCFHPLNIALSLKTVFVTSAPAPHAWPGSGQGPSRLGRSQNMQ